MTNTRAIEMDRGPVWAQGVDARAGFIINTYVHLFGAIIAFAVLEIALIKSGVADRITKRIFDFPHGWLLALGGFMVVSWFASRVAHNARSLFSQYLALAAYVAAEALIFAPLLLIASRFFPQILPSAIIATLLGFSGLTAIAFATRKDFSFLRGVLYWGGLCALVMIVAGVLFGFTLGPVFSVAMICLAGGAILYDTSNILHHYPEDRYVGASLELFASVALLFWYVVRLLMVFASDD